MITTSNIKMHNEQQPDLESQQPHNVETTAGTHELDDARVAVMLEPRASSFDSFVQVTDTYESEQYHIKSFRQ